jgi:predicted PurR-regulated permease PerM
MERDQTVHISGGSVFKTLCIVLLFAAAFILKDLIIVVLMSVVVASAVEPGTQWMTSRKIPRLLAVILIYFVVACILLGTVYFLLVPLLSESSTLLRDFPTYFNAETVSNTIDNNAFLSSQPLVSGLKNSVNLEQVITQINGIITSISSGAFNTVAAVSGGILSFVLIIVLSFYLAVDENGVGKFLKIITPLKHEKYVIGLWNRSQKKIGLWMQGQLVLAVIIGMLVYLGLLLLKVPNALLLAALAAAFEIIPLFGPILASIPAIALSFASGGFSVALLVTGLYLIVHQFENQLIYPLVVKKVVGVPPIVSILALVAGWELAGFIGLVISVPIAAVVIEFFDDFERDKIARQS